MRVRQPGKSRREGLTRLLTADHMLRPNPVGAIRERGPPLRHSVIGSERTQCRRKSRWPQPGALLLQRSGFYWMPDRLGSGHVAVMIVCSCNILSDQDVRTIARDPSYVPPRVGEIYSRLGCNAECGRCVRTIKTIIDEAVAATLPARELAES